ncbi:MAG: hypothetical protein KVP17_003841 [Porospora cf. gigantea B]|nr:MAG: hypothetical protein KVP17_003841 [Porospora cf. gigantea B]
METEDPRKRFRKQKAGKKVIKKKQNDGRERYNPKAFTFSGGVNAARHQYLRSAQVAEMRSKATKMDKTPDVDPPPYIVVVQGPKGVGKTTLIQSLAKHYSKQSVKQCVGPVTCVSSKNRRFTFIECPDDVGAMLDLAKVADLVLVMVDAAFGFEMETFEMLNMLQVHGFPRCIGVLSNLDKIKSQDKLTKTKNKLKKRFWQELYDGAKLFYLSGLEFEKLYKKRDVQNLARFLAVQKVKPLTFRAAHPYVLPLTFEDHSEDLDAETKEIHFFGYLKGARLRERQSVHIPGAGDFEISSIEACKDPCPLPDKQGSKRDGNRSLRTLKDTQRLMYAPKSDVGTLQFDVGGVMVDIGDVKTPFTRGIVEDEGELPQAVQLVRELQDSMTVPISVGPVTVSRRRVRFEEDDGSDFEEGSPPDEAPPATESEEIQLHKRHRDHSASRTPCVDAEFWPEPKPVTGADEMESESEESIHSDSDEDPLSTSPLFDIPPSAATLVRYRHRGELPEGYTPERLIVPAFDDEAFEGAYDESTEACVVNDDWLLAVLASSFPDITAEVLLGSEERDAELKEDVEVDLTVDMLLSETNVALIKGHFFITGGWVDAPVPDSEKSAEPPTEEEVAAADRLRDLKQKQLLDEAREFSIKEDAAFVIGTFVRVVVRNVPSEWVSHRLKHPEWPMLLGGLLPGESKYGMVQCRFKKHRWAPRILKNEDPVLLSVGWRRFQSIPIYSIEDRNDVRVRMLKYTPEHLHCLANFYGPLAPPNSGVLAIRTFDQRVPYYRISGTGNILQTAENFKILKKLKLIGRPDSIKKRTVFVKGMFTSDLEVNKCLGARLQTPSGIRGEIKKPIGTLGRFRAAFEDQLHPNDLVMLKSWTTVQPKKFCNPVLDREDWRKIRTISELRRAHQVPIPQKPGSAYVGKTLERKERVFSTAKIPKNVMVNLPFDAREVEVREKRIKDKLVEQETAVMMSEFEARVSGLLDGLKTTKDGHLKAQEAKNKSKAAARKRLDAKADERRGAKEKEKRKKRYLKEGQILEARRKKMRAK